MMNVVRRSQIIGLFLVDGSTASQLGFVEEIWLNETGRIAYLSSGTTYLPLEQISEVGTTAVVTYSRMVAHPSAYLHRLHQFVVRSTIGESLGWVDDFLFDWHTGEIAAYVLTGELANPFGGKAILTPEYVEAIQSETIVISEKTKNRLRSEAEGLKGFLCEKPQPVRTLVKLMSDRLHHLIAPDDTPDQIQTKIYQASDELADLCQYNFADLQEATLFLQDEWQHLQQSVQQTDKRAKSAFELLWAQTAGHTATR